MQGRQSENERICNKGLIGQDQGSAHRGPSFSVQGTKSQCAGDQGEGEAPMAHGRAGVHYVLLNDNEFSFNISNVYLP